MTNLDLETLRAVRDAGVELPEDMAALIAPKRHARPGDLVRNADGEVGMVFSIYDGSGAGTIVIDLSFPEGATVPYLASQLIDDLTDEPIIMPPDDMLPMVGGIVWDDPDDISGTNLTIGWADEAEQHTEPVFKPGMMLYFGGSLPTTWS